MNFGISTWKSNNATLEKGTCNAIDMYMIYILDILDTAL